LNVVPAVNLDLSARTVVTPPETIETVSLSTRFEASVSSLREKVSALPVVPGSIRTAGLSAMPLLAAVLVA
jgi:hypothetical protein